MQIKTQKQRKSPCDVVLWKKLHRIFVRLEKMVSVFSSSPHKVSLQGKNFEGKFSRQKWGLIKIRSVFVCSPLLGKVQKQDFVNNQALTEIILIFTLFRKTQKREWFQTKSGAKRSDFSISRVFLTYQQECCKILWTKEFYKIIARMIFSARLKGEQKKWRLENFTFPRHSEPHFELKTLEFRCEMKFWKSLHFCSGKFRLSWMEQKQ